MALAELGETMSRGRQQMFNATTIDEKVMNEFLEEISRALLQSDVPLEFVSDIQTNMKETFNFIGDRSNKFQIIQLAIFDELRRILYPRNPSFIPEKGKASVIMFVGQWSEKTICTKYAYYHLKKGWKPALVCAYTSSAGAFDQLEQNAINAKIPIYERYSIDVDFWMYKKSKQDLDLSCDFKEKEKKKVIGLKFLHGKTPMTRETSTGG
ncbi:hypothetical protein Ddye_002277 [Dipteronia dyeriana]|uniref:Signal recognition particle SRP54 helical bundle domain-containing protein n=1 Tax=Dipteronia dyeriana TaxID=168575 RepID=A0AAE0CUV4_9ROSI|nr:hypothetical protein Ddye_002277 [Dipteronia dyeriana]